MTLRPVLWLGLAYIAGEALGGILALQYGPVVFIWAAVLEAVFLLNLTGRLPMRKYSKDVWLLVLPVFMIFGYMNLTVSMSTALERDDKIDALSRQVKTSMQITGRVCDCEEKDSCYYVYMDKCFWKTDLTDTARPLEVRRLLAVILKKDLPDSVSEIPWIHGDYVQILGIPECFEHPKNEGMFDEWTYFHARGVDARVWGEDIAVVSKSCSRIYVGAARLKMYMIQNCRKILPENFAGIAISMVTGDRTWLDGDIKELYQLSGISHILAISGLHISFLGMGLYHMLRRLKLPLYGCMAAAVVTIVIYGWFTGMSPSTARAVIMTGMSVTAKAAGYTYDRVTAMSIAAFLLLVKAPLLVSQPGFLLSFGAAASLSVSEHFVPKQKIKGTGMKRLSGCIQKTLVPALAVTLGMLPLTAWCFFEIPVYSIFLNLAVIPLMSLLYPCMLMGALLAPVLGGVKIPLCGLMEGILYIYEKMSRLILRLPGSVIICGKPSAAMMILIYGTMVLFLLVLPKCRWPLFVKRCFIAAGCLMPVLVFVPHIPKEMTVTMVDVGQGDCFLISLPSGENLLVDGGSSDVKQVGTYRLIPFLKCRGIGHLDAVFISHMDSDHVSAIEELLDVRQQSLQSFGATAPGTIAAECMIFPEINKTSDSYGKFLALVRKSGISCFTAAAGDALTFSDLNIRVLCPQKDALPMDANDGSLVFMLEYQGFRALFTGDAGMAAEEGIMRQLAALGMNRDWTCHLLKVAHHGSKNSTSEKILEILKPRLALISCGRDNAYGHPHETLMERLDDWTDAVYVTSECGEVIVRVRRKNVKIVVWMAQGGYNRY